MSSNDNLFPSTSFIHWGEPSPYTSPYTTNPSWVPELTPFLAVSPPPPTITPELRATIAQIVREVLAEQLTMSQTPKAPVQPERPYLVRFGDGHRLTVRASSAEAAKLDAYGRLAAAGHTVPDYDNCVMTAFEV